MFIILHISLS